eukprot:346705_1
MALLIFLTLPFILGMVSGKTEIAYMNLVCDGTGRLIFDGHDLPITAMHGFNYKKDISLNKHNAHKSKHSKLYNVDMLYAVGPLAPNVYIHAGGLIKSLGCPHLRLTDAMKFYNFVVKSDKVQLVTSMAYEEHSSLCEATHFLQNLFSFRWFAKEESYGDILEQMEVDDTQSAQSVIYDNSIAMDHMNTENYEQTSPFMFMINVISVAFICSLTGAIVGIAFGCLSKVNS